MKELTKALIQARENFPPIPKNKTGNAGGRPYRYADIHDVISAISETLKDNCLFLYHSYDKEHQVLVTTIMHESGDSISNSVPMVISGFKGGSAVTMQNVGSALTYARRYGVSSLLSLVTDDDTDGDTVEQDTRAPVKKRPQDVRALKDRLAKFPDYEKIIAKRLKNLGLSDLSDITVEVREKIEKSLSQKEQDENDTEF